MQDSNFSENRGNGGFSNQGGGFQPRPMVEGSWKCSDCGVEINKLPFEPKEGRPVYCLDCYRKNNPRRDFRR